MAETTGDAAETEARDRPYHHGRLREVVLEAALEEIEAVGTGNMSMREIARRAGVSHAAPAHHFGDKAGIFTAIAADGNRLLAQEMSKVVPGTEALTQCGIGYVRFALTHRAHFEVMFRPELYRADDADVVASRDETFQILYEAVQQGLGADREDEILGTCVAAWSAVHGFSTLWLYGNLGPKLGGERDPLDAMVSDVGQGFVAFGEILSRQVRGERPATTAQYP